MTNRLKTGETFHFLFPFLKKNLVYSVAILLERGVSFLLLPLYTHVFMPVEYGVYAILLAFLTFAAFVYSLGIENGLLKYNISREDNRRLLSTTFWGMVALAALLSAGLALFSNGMSVILLKHPDYAPLLRLTAAILFMDTLVRFFLFAVVGRQQSRFYLTISMMRGGLSLLLNCLLLIVFRLGLKGIFYSHLIASGVVAIVLLGVYRRRLDLLFDFTVFRRILSFGLPMMMSSFGLALLHLFDRFLLRHFYDASVVGEYSMAYKIGMILNVAVSAFNMGALPFVSHAAKSEDDRTSVFSDLLIFSTTVFLVIFLFFGLFVSDLVRIRIFGFTLIHENYLVFLDIVPLVLLGYVFFGLYSSFILPLYHFEKTKVLPVMIGAGFLINFGLNMLLIPACSAWGAATATLTAFFAMSLMACGIAKRLVPEPYDWPGLAWLLTAAVISFGIVRLLFPGNLLWKTGVFIFFCLFVLYRLIQGKKRKAAA